MAHQGLDGGEDGVGVLDGVQLHVVGLSGRICEDLICLRLCLLYELVCLRVGLLHDLVLRYHLLGLLLRILNHALCLILRICKDRILLGNDLLVLLDLIRNTEAKLNQKLLHLLFIYKDLRIRQWLILTAVNVLLNLTD